MARKPLACHTEKRLLGENLVNDRQMPCSALAWVRMGAGIRLNSLF